MYTPLFVVGSGRSGTTLMYELLALHNEFAWASNLSNRLPWLPEVICLSRSNQLRKFRVFQPASETIEGFSYCGVGGVCLPYEFESLDSEYDIKGIENRTRAYVARHLFASGKAKFLSKNTSNSMKIDLLRAIFPDACFVHIHRHPFGVVSSLLEVGFWRELPLWWAEYKTPLELENDGMNKVVIAGRHWCEQVDLIQNKLEKIEEEYVYSVSYEELISDPLRVMKAITDKFQLTFTNVYRQKLNSKNISSGSVDKWKQSIGSEVTHEARNVVSPTASRLGYFI